MGSLLELLIEFFAGIWRADSEVRDQSRFGESEMDRRSRRFIAWVCGGAIGLIVLAGFLWWWLAGKDQ